VATLSGAVNLFGLQLDLIPLTAAYVATISYVVCAHRLRGRRASLSGWRVGAYVCGVVVFGVCVGSPLESRADQLLSVHMAQHLVLIMVVAPLIVAGQPAKVALRALPPEKSRWLVRTVAVRLGVCGNPAVRVTVFSAVVAATHFSPLYNLALRDELVHALEHLVYVAGACLFWSTLVGSHRRLTAIGAIGYVLLAMPAMGAVGAVFMGASKPLYSNYLAPAHKLGVSALADQQLAGAVMWIGGSMALMVALVAIAWSRLLLEERIASGRQPTPRRRSKPQPTLEAQRWG
jgi:putative membrane protein